MDWRWFLGLVLATGCAGLNPSYGANEGASSTSGSGPDPTRPDRDTDPPGGTTGSVTSGVVTSGLGDEGTSSGGSGPAMTSGMLPDLGDNAESGGVSQMNIAWLSRPVQGDFGLAKVDPCAIPPVDADTCVEAPVQIVGRTMLPLSELDGTHQFLSRNGPLYAAGSGVKLSDDYAALVSLSVTAEFVTALAVDVEVVELSLWWGPSENTGLSCGEWELGRGSGDAAQVALGAIEGTTFLASCDGSLHILCACPIEI